MVWLLVPPWLHDDPVDSTAYLQNMQLPVELAKIQEKKPDAGSLVFMPGFTQHAELDD